MTTTDSSPSRGLAAGLDVRTETCPEHGQYQAKIAFGHVVSTCPTCAREQADRDKARALAEASRKLFDLSGIPKRFAGKGIDTFEVENERQEGLVASLKAYADSFPEALESGRSLIFVGSTGTGKTHLACGIAREIIGQGYSARYCTAIQAARSVKATYAKDSTVTEEDAIKALTAPDLLILDEVGVQFGSNAEAIILFEVLNTRYVEVKPTIVISNLGEAEITSFLGDRIMDRLREGGGKTILFPWKSYRR